MSEQELVTGEKVGDPEESEVTTATSAEESPDADQEVVAEVDQPEETLQNIPSEKSHPSTDTADDDTSEPISILTLKRGQYVTGKVKNITGFGAFVDIGLPQDGLVHISELARQKVEKVDDVVSVGEEVDVWVKKVDKKRGRISLTMIKPIARRIRDINEGAELEGTVTRLESYGAFVDIDSERDGLVHISQITHDYIKHPEEALAVGDKVRVKVLKVNRKKRQIDLSIKALTPPPEPEKIEKVQEPEKVVEEIIEEEPAPTAMALAYAAMQQNKEGDESDDESSVAKEKQKRKQEMDDIIARTLATSD